MWGCLLDSFWWSVCNGFTSKSNQFQISPAASQQLLHHTVWRTWLFIAYSDGRWLYYQSKMYSIHLTHLPKFCVFSENVPRGIPGDSSRPGSPPFRQKHSRLPEAPGFFAANLQSRISATVPRPRLRSTRGRRWSPSPASYDRTPYPGVGTGEGERCTKKCQLGMFRQHCRKKCRVSTTLRTHVFDVSSVGQRPPPWPKSR